MGASADAQQELNRLTDSFDLTTNTHQMAGVICTRACEEGLYERRSAKAIAASALYAATRQVGISYSLGEIAPVAQVDRVAIGRTYKLLTRELGIDIEPTDPNEPASRFLETLDLSEHVAKTTHEIIDSSIDADINSGCSPASIAAGALYLATQLHDVGLTQAEVANVTEVAPVTIRSRYKEQEKLLGIGRQNHPSLSGSISAVASRLDASQLSVEVFNTCLDRFEIVEMESDLFESHTRCCHCGRTGTYGELLDSHYTRRIDGEQVCYDGEMPADLFNESLDRFEVVEMDFPPLSARVRCIECGAEGRYKDMRLHYEWNPDDRIHCPNS